MSSETGEEFYTPPGENHDLSLTAEDDSGLIVGDSDSSVGLPIVEHAFNQHQFSSSDDEAEEEGPIIPSVREHSSEEDEEGMPSPKKVSRSTSAVKIRQFDLGASFDAKINDHINKMTQINNEANESFTLSENTNNKLVNLIKEFREHIADNSNIDDSLISQIVNESVSDKYKDWYFMTLNCDPNHSQVSIKDMLLSFGVSNTKMEQETVKDEDVLQYDTFCELFPIDEMLEHTAKALTSKQLNYETKIRYFLYFILDRNIYDSSNMDFMWCQKTLRSILGPQQTLNSFFDLYFKIFQLERTKYLFIYRLIRLLPAIKNDIVSYLFKTKEDFIKEFDCLFDAKDFRNLLYFILSTYGSHMMPFGENQHTQYFIDCVYDLSKDGNNDVELTILNGLLNIFMKM